jgi:propionyl-CoA carboxylase alpha chain
VRVVRETDDLVDAVETVRREATAAFGDGTVFLEPCLDGVRHIDVQVFADPAGRVVHLFERDCTIGLGHQPVIFEAPAPKLAQPLRERLVAAAVAVAEAAGYVGAGTVEFLASGERLWFVEMNSRLEVEHPVTEAILGLDLVDMQLAVAEGRPLPVEARHCSPSGHAIGVRLCAVEPVDGYRPQPNRVRRFEIDPGPGVRVETGLVSGSGVVDDDAGLATIVASAATRPEAVRRLVTALETLRVHGPRTNRELLIAALRHPEFGAGAVDAGFLDRHHADDVGTGRHASGHRKQRRDVDHRRSRRTDHDRRSRPRCRHAPGASRRAAISTTTDGTQLTLPPAGSHRFEVTIR